VARQLELHLELPEEESGDLLQVDVDGDRILQVLDNLLHNAVRFTPSGGAIRVSGKVVEGQVTFSVSDTGIGIAPEAMRHLFEPFFGARDIRHHSSGTIEFNSGGMGLGLAIARGIVRGHGGELFVESRAREGSTFRFTLPLAEGAESMEEAA
jgi:signal transduction histidine kinase